ncbi:MAG: DUF4783 domain-containing protein [Chitinophagales bacterium]|nr:DUF4783 domain-containing protein [Chitinophagales bacterium]
MKNFRHKKFVILLLVAVPLMAFSIVDILDNIGSAIKSGESKQVARFFDNNVELTILDRESTYSRTQAEMVLRDFFAKNPVQSFDLIHRGTSDEGSAYGIGKLKTSTQTFRVYYYVKQKGSQSLLQEMRFEKEK